MSESTSTRTGQSAAWDPAMARAFFEAAGKLETAAAGDVFFTEQQKANRLFLKRDRMYFLVEGEVELSAGGKPIGTAGAGEIFGEMACISHTPRSATATARSNCKVISLDDRQFEQGLRAKPEFALMMMRIMISRLHASAAKLIESTILPVDAAAKESAVFGPKLLAELKADLDETPPVFYDAKKVIIREGQTGVLMYVVLEGRVAIRVAGALVERVGPGGVFGEMALVDESPRAASAVAETDCSLLAIDRKTFLGLMTSKPAFGVSLLTAAAERAGNMAARLA